MKFGSSRNARLSAAVMAALCVASPLYADNLIWDPSQSSTGGTDGTGIWDNGSTADWYSATLGTNTTFNSATPDSVTFGTTPTLTGAANSPYLAVLNSNITVNNITFNGEQTATGASASFTPYAIANSGGQTLTIAGNITKAATNGNFIMELTTPTVLTAGVHTVSIADTPGDSAELTSAGGFTGAGSLVLDNTTASEGGSYGTFVLDSDSNYTGNTTITNGRIVINTAQALSTTQVNIGAKGNLAIGGAGASPAGSLSIGNAINITRNTYTGTDYGDYPDALTVTNTGQASNVYTLTGPITVDSTDARIATNTAHVTIASTLVAGTSTLAAGGTPLADFDGDFSGFVTLTADNTSFGNAGGAIGIRGGVELLADSEAELGGPTSKLVLSGGEIHPTGSLAAPGSAFLTNFGAHTIVGGTVSTGVTLDAGVTFNASNLSGGGIGERGTGTLNFGGTNTFTGTPFFDGGIINFQAGSNTKQVGLRLRSPVVNISGTLNVGGSYSSIGADSTGTNGGPDKATVNILSGGSLIEASGDDFNVSDNANTAGTINLNSGGTFTTQGTTYFGKSSGATGTLNMTGGTFNASSLVFVGENNGTGVFNQSGGTTNLTRTGNFTFVVSDGRNGTNTSSYSLSGANSVLNSTGEIYVGEGGNSHGTLNQSGGTINLSNWFVVGREGGTGTVNISGGTFNKTGGGNFSMGEGGAHVGTMNVTGTGVVNDTSGEFYVGNNGSVGILNVGQPSAVGPNATTTAADAAASLTVSNWFAIGRTGNATGTLNLYDGTVNKVGSNYLDIAGDGSATAVVNVMGGTLNSNATIIGENAAANGTLNVSGGTANFTSNLLLARSNTATATINLSGTGTINSTGFTVHDGGGTGAVKMNFNGGVLNATAANADYLGTAITSTVSTGGAVINNGGYAITVNSALTHDSSITGADGGLKVSGLGTTVFTGANSYTGLTTQKNGTLQLNTLAQAPVLTGGGEDLQFGKTVFDYNGGSDPVATVASLLTTSYHSPSGAFAAGQIHSSTAVANVYGLGYGDNTTTQQVTVLYTLYGDANLDSGVGIDDFNTLIGHFGTSTGQTWSTGDFTYDGGVGIDDFNALIGNFGKTVSPTGSVSAVALSWDEWQPLYNFAVAHNDTAEFIAITGVPEPTTFGVVMAGAMSLGLRRRRRSVR